MTFKQFINQDPDANDAFVQMPIRIKASFFNPDSRTQVLFLQHTLDRKNHKPEPQASHQSPTNNKREPIEK